MSDISSKEANSVTITPASNTVETVAIDNNKINELCDMDMLDMVISMEEIKLSDYDYELYRSSAEYHGLPVALNDKFNYKIRYKSDDFEVIGYVSAPADYLEKKYPILIYNRGGNGNLGEVTPAEVSLYAHMGFITLATQYRGNDDGTGKDEFGGADVQDVISLIDIAEQLPFGNGKLYMFGASRGGLETYCTLKEEYLAGKDRISAAVIGFGVSDLIKLYQFRDQGMKDTLIKYIGGTPEQLPEEYEKRSAVCWPELINTPLLICHGKTDERAPVEQAETMYDLLKEQNKDVELILHEKGHGFTKEVFRYAFEWMSSH
jgi:dipeptidyl aminopeptidase/acylaminoacyl peptidase